MEQNFIDLTGNIENIDKIGDNAKKIVKCLGEDYRESINKHEIPFIIQFFYIATNPLLTTGRSHIYESHRNFIRRSLNERIEKYLNGSYDPNRTLTVYNTNILITNLEETNLRKILKIQIGFNEFKNRNDTLLIFIVASKEYIESDNLNIYLLFENPTNYVLPKSIIRSINNPNNRLSDMLLYSFYNDIVSPMLNPTYNKELISKSVMKDLEESIYNILMSGFGGSNTSIFVKGISYDLNTLTCEISVSYITYDATNYAMSKEDIDEANLFYIHMDLDRRQVKVFSTTTTAPIF